MKITQKPLPQNDRQLKSAVRDQLSLEAKVAERSIWPSLKTGAMIVGGLLFLMAFVPLLLNLLPDSQVGIMCNWLGASDLANLFLALRTDCRIASPQMHVPILSFLQMVLLVTVFLWMAVLVIIALVREYKYASRFGHQHLLPMHWGYGGSAAGLGVIAAAICLMAYCLWLLTTPGLGQDDSRPMVLRTQSDLQPVYYALDSLLFALAGVASAVAVYWLAMTLYCAIAQLRQKLRLAD